MTPDPFAACKERTVVRVLLLDGMMLTDAHTTRARLHFVQGFRQ